MQKKALSPAHRRAAALAVVASGLCSRRAACRILRLARSTLSYQCKAPTTLEQQLRKRLHELSVTCPHYGYRRITALLGREGWQVGKRHIQRLRRLELIITRRLDGLLHGQHAGLLPGPGSETAGSREYRPGEDEVRRALAGNLCRCTGYQKIVQAVLEAAAAGRGA